MLKTKPQHYKFFFKVKVDAPISSANAKSLLNQRGEPKSSRLFYKPRSWYTVNQSGSAMTFTAFTNYSI